MVDDLPESQANLPIPYVTQYTNKTLTITPLIVTAVRVWAVAMLEWGSLRFIDHAPLIVWIASSIIAALVLVVLEKREWLNFKNKKYFSVSLTILMLIWVCITGCAYYFDNSVDYTTPVAANLKSQLDSALKERDAALQERDAARRAIPSPDHAAPQSAPPSATPAAPVDDPNEYPPLTRERERALVNELVNSKTILGTVPIFRAGPYPDAFVYRAELLRVFDRATVPTVAGDESTGGPDQTGVMIAITDLTNPSPASKKMLEILTITGMRPKVIQAKPGHGDFYIFIGPRPL